jgi:thioester reductase-like protein
MIKTADIERVYCLVRARDPEDAINRVLHTMKKFRVLSDLSAAETRKIAALPSDFSSESLGLTQRC